MEPDHTDPYYRSHRRQLVWQILLPVILLTVVLAIVFFLVTTGGEKQVRLVADVALLLLLLPLLFLALGGMIALSFAVVVVARLMRWLPPRCAQVQRYVAGGQTVLQRLADRSVQPVFWIHQMSATLQQIADTFLLRGKR